MKLWPFGKTEKRDVKFSPQLSRYLAALSSTSNVNVTPDTASRLMAVHACVQVIAQDVASVPWITYKRLKRGRERANGYRLYSLLHDSPNPEQDAYAFKELILRHLLLHGNAYGLVVMENGRASEIWPVSPSSVSVRRVRNGPLEYYIALPSGGYLSLPPMDAGSGAPQQIWHIRGPSNDGVTGLSPIALAKDAIGLGLAQQEFAAGFFARGARPSMILEHPGALSPEAHERLRNEFEALHTGLDNAQRVAILEEGMKAHALTIAQEDAQFLEQRKFAVEEIARLYRVHPHKIGVMEGTQTYASVEQANIDHVVSTVRPWAVRLEMSAMKNLIPAEERERYYTEFLLTALLRGDNAGRAEYYRTMWNIGCFTANEIRELENMNPIEGGDDLFVPINMQPLDMAAASMMEAEPEMAPASPRAQRNGAAVGAGRNGGTNGRH